MRTLSAAADTYRRSLGPTGEAIDREIRDRLNSHFLAPGEVVDEWSLAVVSGRAAIWSHEARGLTSIAAAARELAGPILKQVLVAGQELPFASCPPLDPGYFLEQFLETYRSQQRTVRGVFYTPRPLVRYVVAELDDWLREALRLVDGLADTSTWRELYERHGFAIPGRVQADSSAVGILDPAMGSGLFLIEVVRQISALFLERINATGDAAQLARDRWNDYVRGQLLDRMRGLDVSLAALTVTHCNLAAALLTSGFEPAAGDRLLLGLVDALSGPSGDSGGGRGAEQDELAVGQRFAFDEPSLVLLGNPPFSGVSPHNSRWIRGLLRGEHPHPGVKANYFRVDGEELRERKSWLQDDYVKFFRFAQFHTEHLDAGAIALVTNHGYLDNATFRGMRSALLTSFPMVRVLDLHGNRKKHEVTPGNQLDENLFAIEQGTAVGFFGRAFTARSRRVQHGDLWGSRREKETQLESRSPQFDTIDPGPPHFLLTPSSAGKASCYDQAFSIQEAMPVNSTAVVTARDRLVIAIHAEELRRKLCRFRDLSISDDIIRGEFASTRSKKYQAGDTRSWRMAEARARLAGLTNWEQSITRCLYRPYDERAIFWTDWMVDWPRGEIMRHMQTRDNWALITRRQMLPNQPCCYFWVSNQITVDGVIRSDNRGSESVFPLYLDAADGSRTANFSAALIDRVCRLGDWEWVAEGAGDLERSIGPRDLFCYLYGVVHSPSYRRLFADDLRLAFPRLPLVDNGDLFGCLRRAGERLVKLHLTPETVAADRLPAWEGEVVETIPHRYPLHDGSQILLAPNSGLGPVSPAVWNFRVGGHQPCRKWLRDRRQMTLAPADLDYYRTIVASIAETLSWMQTIDRAIDAHGGWLRAAAE